MGYESAGEDLIRTGYHPVLDNGDLGSVLKVEELFDRGVVGTNTIGIYLEEVRQSSSIVFKNSRGGVVSDVDKILYADPKEVPQPPGYRGPVKYMGGSVEVRSGKKNVGDTALMIVESETPVENDAGLEEVKTLLIGDPEDRNLEDRGIALRFYS